jgi:ATP-dependent Lon protease
MNLANKVQLESLPSEIFILPIRAAVAYPLVAFPVEAVLSSTIRLIEELFSEKSLIGLLAVKDQTVETPTSDQLYQTGTIAFIDQVLRLENDVLQVIFQGIERFDVEEWIKTEPHKMQARIRLRYDVVEKGIELEALKRSLRDLAKEIVLLTPDLPKEIIQIIDNIEDERHLLYFVASISSIAIPDKQNLLENDKINEKYRSLLLKLTEEKEVLFLGKKIKAEVSDEVTKTEREYYLRQELKAIHKELGEKEEDIVAEYTIKIEKAKMSDEAKKEAHRELERIAIMSPQSVEYPLAKTYLDWLVDLPWQVISADQLDISNARRVLDIDHYDIDEVKDRILEYLAVRKILRDRNLQREAESKEMATILCFVGPPGVGKTSLGQSIARALGRKFTRMSLGGIRDEAEIRGHRRTYIGALPGRIIQL